MNTPWIIEFFDQTGRRITGTTSKELDIIPRENESIELERKIYKVAHVLYRPYFRKIRIICQQEIVQ